MCKPHKALRMTIKVHLKTEEKKLNLKMEEKKRAEAEAEANTSTIQDTPETAAPIAAATPAPAQIDDNDQPGPTDPMAQVDEVGFTHSGPICLQHTHVKQVSHEQPHDEAPPSDAQSHHQITEQESAPEHTQRVNQTPGVEEDAIVQTTEGEELDIKQDAPYQDQATNGDSTQDAYQNQGTNASASVDPSNPNTNNMDWNTNAAFNPMMNMPNMQQGWGGFNNMMGKQ